MKPWRKAVTRKTIEQEHWNIRGKSFTWRKTSATTVTLECGHQKVYKGFFNDGPEKARCKECPDTA